MVEVRMDYEAVGALADQFAASADFLHRLDRALETAITVLRTTAFVGNVGSAAMADYLGRVHEAVMRLAATCDEFSEDLVGAIRALRDGDHSGSQRFTGQGSPGGVAAAGVSVGPGITAAKQPVALGNAVSLSRYQNGVNGWRLIPIGGEFTPGELVAQQGPSCTVYGAMNLLIENGYDISQAEADQLYQDQLNTATPLSDIWFDMLDGEHETGFPRSDAVEIIEQHGANYQHSDFEGPFGFGSPDRAEAEKFLVEQVGSGRPVYVTTSTDDTFGIKGGGHAYTVLGVQQDEHGNLSKVLVSTNWSEGAQVYEIPADTFMDSWLNFNEGEYIVITGKQ